MNNGEGSIGAARRIVPKAAPYVAAIAGVYAVGRGLDSIRDVAHSPVDVLQLPKGLREDAVDRLDILLDSPTPQVDPENLAFDPYTYAGFVGATFRPLARAAKGGRVLIPLDNASPILLVLGRNGVLTASRVEDRSHSLNAHWLPTGATGTDVSTPTMGFSRNGGEMVEISRGRGKSLDARTLARLSHNLAVDGYVGIQNTLPQSR